ncbi:hypothetical protein OS493_033922 [Desmophyllum pertusum]|uniref:Uncharacterized protein n=1 Tax=Desmophyllum pertusum TaxID=174260 RepID=A0A9W9ZXZ1_9CNID|nr:hypothetical protein OS493_033922 [Desmophyllum pertusum]
MLCDSLSRKRSAILQWLVKNAFNSSNSKTFNVPVSTPMGPESTSPLLLFTEHFDSLVEEHENRQLDSEQEKPKTKKKDTAPGKVVAEEKVYNYNVTYLCSTVVNPPLRPKHLRECVKQYQKQQAKSLKKFGKEQPSSDVVLSLSLDGVKMTYAGGAGDVFPLQFCKQCHGSPRKSRKNCLKDGEDPNSINEYGFTPLHCVTYEKEEAYKMVQLLLNYGADMLNRDHGLGRLPFEYALRVANKKACQTFVDGGFSLQKSHRMRNGTYELLSNVYLGSSDPSVYEMVEVDAIEVLQVLVDLGVRSICYAIFKR